MKLSKSFELSEFVPPELYQLGEDFAIRFTDTRLVALAQFIKDRFNRRTIINDWIWGGQYKFSGFRTQSSPDWKPLSPHSRGLAIDIKVDGLTPDTLRQDIRDNYGLYRQLGLMIIEKDTPTWVHLSVERTNTDQLMEVPYK